MASHDLSSMDYGEEEIDKALWEVGFRRDLRKQQREIINDVQSKSSVVEVLLLDQPVILRLSKPLSILANRLVNINQSSPVPKS